MYKAVRLDLWGILSHRQNSKEKYPIKAGCTRDVRAWNSRVLICCLFVYFCFFPFYYFSYLIGPTHFGT